MVKAAADLTHSLTHPQSLSRPNRPTSLLACLHTGPLHQHVYAPDSVPPWALQHLVSEAYDYGQSAAIGRIVGVLHPPPWVPESADPPQTGHTGRPPLGAFRAPHAQDALRRLGREGFVSLGQVRSGWVERLVEAVEARVRPLMQPMRESCNRTAQEMERGAVLWQSPEGALLWQAIEAWELAADPTLQAVVGAHLGAQPVLMKANAKYSEAPHGDGASLDAEGGHRSTQHVMHIDSEALPMVSVFVYLSDLLGPAAACTRYVAGSHTGAGMRRWREHLRRQLQVRTKRVQRAL